MPVDFTWSPGVSYSVQCSTVLLINKLISFDFKDLPNLLPVLEVTFQPGMFSPIEL